jgi:hypothetical protein
MIVVNLFGLVLLFGYLIWSGAVVYVGYAVIFVIAILASGSIVVGAVVANTCDASHRAIFPVQLTLLAPALWSNAFIYPESVDDRLESPGEVIQELAIERTQLKPDNCACHSHPRDRTT